MTDRLPKSVVALTLAALLLAPTPSQSQNYTPLAPLPLGDAVLNLPTPHVLAPGTWELKFTHRFLQAVNGENSDVHSFWGLDGSADVGIGLAYAPMRDFQVSVIRTSAQDDYEIAGKYMLLRQAPDFPLSASFRTGIDWRTERGVEDGVSPFGQLILSKQFARRLEIFAVPTYVGNAGPFDHAFNIPFGFAWSMRPGLLLSVEFIPPNPDRPDDIDSDLGWSIGLKRALGGHYFEVMLSDTPGTHVDHYGTSSFGGLGIDSGNIFLGFNIERQFGRGHKPPAEAIPQ